ncbi:MAG: hypothetical protein AAF098_11815 [Pseudomonadota bacterium]
MLDPPVDLNQEKTRLLESLAEEQPSTIQYIDHLSADQPNEAPAPPRGLTLVSRSGQRLSAGALTREMRHLILATDVRRSYRETCDPEQPTSATIDPANGSAKANCGYLLDIETGYVSDCDLPLSIDAALNHFAKEAGLVIEGYELTVSVRRIDQ